MSRQGNRVRLGYFPIPEEVMAAIGRRVRFADDTPLEERTLLDPCAGAGRAVAQLATVIGVPRSGIYAVELDDARSDEAGETLGENANLLMRTSFQSTRISANSFSVVYLNPPFDSELGGGRREELSFLSHCTKALAPKGLLIFVLPYTVLGRDSRILAHLDSCYEDVIICRFPQSKRKFNESIVFATKRRHAVTLLQRGELERMAWDIERKALPIDQEQRIWTAPRAIRAKRFEKIDFTPEELLQELEKPPILDIFDDPTKIDDEQPGLPVNDGQTLLTMVSGRMDGAYQKPGEEPFVLRGAADKVNFLKEDVQLLDEEGRATGRKTTYGQEARLTCRIVDGRFDKIYTLNSIAGKPVDLSAIGKE